MEQFTKAELETIKYALCNFWSDWCDKAREEGISQDRSEIRYKIAEDSWTLYEKTKALLGD